MKLLSRRRRARRLEKELGRGLWRQAHDRFVRGLDRYHQILEGVDDDAVHNELVRLGDELAEALPSLRACCAAAQRRWPAEEMRIPGGAARLHSELSRAANHLATTAEAAAMVRLGSAEIAAVRRRADRVLECVEQARALADEG